MSRKDKIGLFFLNNAKYMFSAIGGITLVLILRILA